MELKELMRDIPEHKFDDIYKLYFQGFEKGREHSVPSPITLQKFDEMESIVNGISESITELKKSVDINTERLNIIFPEVKKDIDRSDAYKIILSDFKGGGNLIKWVAVVGFAIIAIMGWLRAISISWLGIK